MIKNNDNLDINSIKFKFTIEIENQETDNPDKDNHKNKIMFIHRTF